jgi:hypothetical protein
MTDKPKKAKMNKFVTYGRDPSGAVIQMFTIFSDKDELTWSELKAFQQQLMAQQKLIVAPSVDWYTVEELKPVPKPKDAPKVVMSPVAAAEVVN